jgi:hypothetical protein
MSDIFGIRRLVVAHIEKSTNRVEVSSVGWGMRPGHALDANEGREVTICKSPRSSDPLGPLRITFAREVTSPSLKHEGLVDLNPVETQCVESSVS